MLQHTFRSDYDAAILLLLPPTIFEHHSKNATLGIRNDIHGTKNILIHCIDVPPSRFRLATGSQRSQPVVRRIPTCCCLTSLALSPRFRLSHMCLAFVSPASHHSVACARCCPAPVCQVPHACISCASLLPRCPITLCRLKLQAGRRRRRQRRRQRQRPQ